MIRAFFIKSLVCFLALLSGTVYAQSIRFDLFDNKGPVSHESYPGKYLLMAIGYTSCPDICPTTLYEFGAAMRAIKNPDAIQPLFVTIDPTNDEVNRLNAYTGFFANTGGHVALFDFEKSKEATHFTVDFSPREFRTGWLETTLILGGDKALQFQSFDDPNDKTLIELPAAVADMWVSGDSKTLYLTLEDGEPQVLRYDIRRREALAPLLIHGVIKGSALRMGSTNSVCH